MKKRVTNTVLIVLVFIIWITAGKRLINSSKDIPPKEVENFEENIKPLKSDSIRMLFVYNRSIRDPFSKQTEPKKTNEPKLQIPKKKIIRNPYFNTKLLGVLFNGPESVAILNTGKTDHYLHLGDSLNGGILSDVMKDSVVFKVQKNKWVIGM